MSDMSSHIGRITLLPPGAREFLRRRLIESSGCVLIGLGAAKGGGDKVIPTVVGSSDDGRFPLLGALVHPLMVLGGNLAQQVSADGIEPAIAVEETDDALGLLKGLDQPIEQ